MAPGVAEYREPGKEPSRIFLNEDTVRKMDPSFVGRPVYVEHVDKVDVANIQAEADGYVTESFYNEADGKHWVKFIVVSDSGQDAIRKGWRLSNAYRMLSRSPGGMSKGVSYNAEVTAAEYEHLAIVQNPRYEDSIVLSPTQFKEYNNTKRQELSRVANSLTEGFKTMFEFFKKSKVENTTVDTDLTIKLPKSGKEVSIAQLIANAMDMDKADEPKEKKEPEAMEAKEDKKENVEEKPEAKKEEKPAGPAMADMDHHVMIGNSSMALKDLVAAHGKMSDCMNSIADHYGKMSKGITPAGGGLRSDSAGVADAQKADLTKRNEAESVVEPAKVEPKKSEHFDALKNAPAIVYKNEAELGTELYANGSAKGKARYGSPDGGVKTTPNALNAEAISKFFSNITKA